MAIGTVKWFNQSKGYGFIQPDNGGKDVFVHISAVQKAGYDGLAEGAKISYEIVTDRGKESAGNLPDRLIGNDFNPPAVYSAETETLARNGDSPG